MSTLVSVMLFNMLSDCIPCLSTRHSVITKDLAFIRDKK